MARYGKAWHLLAPEMQEALIKSVAFDLIASQVGGGEMVAFARDVLQEIGRRAEEG